MHVENHIYSDFNFFVTCTFQQHNRRNFFLLFEEKKVQHTKDAPPGGLEPPTFRLTAERASQLRHGGSVHEETTPGYMILYLPHCMGPRQE
jgi:hypothetical protein